MRRRGRIVLTICSCSMLAAAAAHAQSADAPTLGAAVSPDTFTLQQKPETIYAPPESPSEQDGFNGGGGHVDLTVRYLTDYIFRGIDRSEVGGHEDAPNIQFDGKLSFDLGKLPHPFIAVFVNVYDSDPISRFQEVRPSIGFDWPIKPLTFSVGYTDYIFPNRDNTNTSEVFGQITLDDSFFWSSERPVITPYVYAAYDYDRENGWYLEAGLKHDFVLEDYGITFTLLGDVGYVIAEQLYLQGASTHDTGFQHYDLGLIGSYSLNDLLNLSRRFGEFSVQGYLYYTDGLEQHLRADTQVWGGAGIRFEY